MLVVTLLLASAESPVGRVVELLTGMKAKIEADGRTEQAIYDKYACWCEETTARKASAIDESKTSIDNLSQRIVELSARQGSSTAEIRKLRKDIADNKESTNKGESLRQKEAGEAAQQKLEFEQSIDALGKAIAVLAKGTAGFTPAMVETQMLTVAAGVRSALRVYKRKDSDEAASADLTPVKSFLANPAAWVQTGSPHLQKYAHQSGEIVGMLKSMLDSFTDNLATLKQEEETNEANYKSMMKGKADELALLEATLTSKSTSDGEDGKQLSDDKLEREETQKQLKVDTAFFDELKQGCKKKADEWAARSRVRAEEISGIGQAVAILSSDEAKATFEASAATLLQVAASASPAKAAYRALKAAATKAQSVQLAALASRVYTAGHFDEVLGEIDTMVQHLRDEETDDEKQRDWCQKEKSNSASRNENLQYDMDQLANKVERQENKRNELNLKISETEQAMVDVQTAMNASLATRNEEHAVFQQALKDDSDAITLLGKAIEVLAAFYEPALLQAEPTDNEPESWSGDYKGKQTAGGGIVSILEMIKEDIQNEIATSREEEAAAHSEYERLRGDSYDSLNAMKAKKNTLQQDVAAVDKVIADTQAVAYDKGASKNATDAYLSDLAPNCDWVERTFETRREQRKSEMSGLENAKAILAGSGALVATHAAASKSAPKPAAPESVDAQLKELDAITFSFLQRRRI